jgi:endonuclease/exonuclease/phosphatase (EEP) superfamily protein YafD
MQYPTDRAFILRLDERVVNYVSDVSDHRPVVVTFPAF